MKHQVLLFTGLISAGVVIGATLVSTGDPDKATQQSTNPKTSFKNIANIPANFEETSSADNSIQFFQQTVDKLQEKLQQEIEHRQKLEAKIALLEKELKHISTQTKSSDNDTQEAAQLNPHLSGLSSQNLRSPSTGWFNEQAMLDAGIDPSKVNFIKQSFEQAEMDKLYLRNQAKREGWLNSKRYTDAAKEIADRTKALRNELSESEYDAYLFAAGQANRVIVSSVLSASPASDAGIQPGDTILRYDNKRVYNWSDLTNATSEGSTNDTVTVTIERNGQPQQVYLQRGPLGVRLATDSVAP